MFQRSRLDIQNRQIGSFVVGEIDQTFAVIKSQIEAKPRAGLAQRVDFTGCVIEVREQGQIAGCPVDHTDPFALRRNIQIIGARSGGDFTRQKRINQFLAQTQIGLMYQFGCINITGGGAENQPAHRQFVLLNRSRQNRFLRIQKQNALAPISPMFRIKCCFFIGR